MEYCYTGNYVVRLRRRCREIGCSAAPAFWNERIEVLQACYNGVGPDAWSSKFRAWVTAVLEDFEVSALPHDYEFKHAPRTYLHFTLANARFAINAILEAWHDRKPKLVWRGIILASLCQLFGWKGFKGV
ncbi:MAG: hypothetical protein HPZ91_07280 [Lentisphaeria bacterium]|nr:hypothetical protein [Lentisphaeria bacterium]